jgi:hypothetical protein
LQWVNSQLAVYDKTGTPQLGSPGFINGNAIWAALGPTSLCATTDRGDPMVQYDRMETAGSRHNYRLVYRNFGNFDSLLVTQAVDPPLPAPQVAAVRWWEIRNPFASLPLVYQNSTYAPGTESRWMSSAAFDKRGNIAIGYSASSSTINPAIRITGRLRNDPKNLMRTEVVLKAGTGSQTTTLSRWGDYSAMQIDPADDCTFWFTSQYLAANATFNWRTRIASFKFPNCQ